MRFGAASILQETNTFSLNRCTLSDFSLATGPEVARSAQDTNSEMAGILAGIAEGGGQAVPLVRAWAMPSGPLTGDAFQALRDLLIESLRTAGPLDGLVLSLHGAMVADGFADADGELIAAAREVLGGHVPIVVCLDLHANLTPHMVSQINGLSAYHTDPHVDMAAAGRRAAQQLLHLAEGGSLAVGLAKRPMLIPAETMNTTHGPLAEIRSWAMAAAPDGMVDLLLFPVQPWLDVPQLGLGVAVVTKGDRRGAQAFAERVADRIWERRDRFVMDRFMPPGEAIASAVASPVRPFLLAQSADAPTAGATGDSPALLEPLRCLAPGLVCYVPAVDPAATEACHRAGVGAQVRLTVGASLDDRWYSPVLVEGQVASLGAGTYPLEGVGFHGMRVSMGRYATVAADNLRVLVSERPAWTADPATFRFVGLPPEEADIIVVKSCSDFRPNFPQSAPVAITVDVAGAASPRLEHLHFQHAPRPLWPIDR